MGRGAGVQQNKACGHNENTISWFLAEHANLALLVQLIVEIWHPLGHEYSLLFPSFFFFFPHIFFSRKLVQPGPIKESAVDPRGNYRPLPTKIINCIFQCLHNRIKSVRN